MKIIVSGCSASTGGACYSLVLKNEYELDVTNISLAGNSNYSIIKRVYDIVANKNLSGINIICQLSFLHRIGHYHEISNCWLDYQPNYINKVPQYNKEKDEVTFGNDFTEVKTSLSDNNLDKDVYKELTDMYKTYLKYVYNEDAEFDYLMYKVDMLKSFVESKGNKILFVYQPIIQNEHQFNSLISRGFFNMDGEYSLLKWSTINKKLTGLDSHLSPLGHKVFAKKLYNHFYGDNPKLDKINIL
jgi:hypothetical protein